MSDYLNDVLEGVDLQDVDTSQRGAFTPIPAGEYLVQAIEGGLVRKDNGDAMIKLTFEIVDGEYAERKLFTNLNIRHSATLSAAPAIRRRPTTCCGSRCGCASSSRSARIPAIRRIAFGGIFRPMAARRRGRRLRLRLGRRSRQQPQLRQADAARPG
jgi:hypothetical protein